MPFGPPSCIFSAMTFNSQHTGKCDIKELVRSFALTAVFNSVISLALYFLVLKQDRFLDVFAISQLIGLSICACVHIGMYLGARLGVKAMWGGISVGLFAGIGFGSLLSWYFLSFFQGISLSYYYQNVFKYAAAFGVIFGIPIIYFFSSWSRIQESEKAVQKEKIKRLTLEKEASRISLKLLQAQIEPHFLFNTLSNILTLLDTDVDKGKAMLMDLNEYLRVSLQRTRTPMVTLAQEFEMLRRYLNIYKVRMGERLTFSIPESPYGDDISFPPMIIQPLVENAIRHGLEPKIDGGHISIHYEQKEGVLEITIADTGQGLGPASTRGGVGIDNVNQRLKSIYGEASGVTLSPNLPNGLQAVIRVLP